MPPYGTPPHPYVAMYPPGGIYAHPSMPPVFFINYAFLKLSCWMISSSTTLASNLYRDLILLVLLPCLLLMALLRLQWVFLLFFCAHSHLLFVSVFSLFCAELVLIQVRKNNLLVFMQGNTPGSMEADGKPSEVKEKLPIKRSKGSLGSLNMITGKNNEHGKTLGTSANGIHSKR